MSFLKKYNFRNYYDFSAALILLILPFSAALPNLLLIPLVLLIGFHYKKFKPVYSAPFILFAIAVFIIEGLALFNQSLFPEIRTFSKYLLILLLYILYTQVEQKKYCEIAFLVSVSIVVLLSLFSILNYQIVHPDFVLSNGSIVNELLFIGRPYLGFLLVLGVFIGLKNGEKSNKKYLYYILALGFAFFSIYMAARLSVALNSFLIFLFLVRTKRLSKQVKIGGVFVVGLFLSLLFYSSENLRSRIRIQDNFESSVQAITKWEPRFTIWPCATQIIENDMDLFTGFGSYDLVVEKLTACYGSTIQNKSKRAYFLKAKFKPHNQFLDFLLLGGVIPFLLLVSVFPVVLFSKASFELKLLYLLFLALFMIESMLHRQLIAYLFGIFVALYSNRDLKKVT